MKKKFIIYNSLITLLSLILTLLLSLILINANSIDVAKKTVINYTTIYANNYQEDYSSYLKEVDSSIRVTVISETGEVLADSSSLDVSTLENHLAREEIQAAKNDNPTVIIRDSSSLGEKMMYYALKVNISSTSYVFIRVALTISSVNAYMYLYLPYLIGILLLALVLSILLSIYTNKKLLTPIKTIKQSLIEINEGKYVPRIASSNDNELNVLTNEINDLSDKLQDNINKLQQSEANLTYILNNITDGIVVFSNDLSINLINENAKRIFKVNSSVLNKSLDYLTFNKELINQVKKKTNTIFEMQLDSSYYLCNLHKTNEDISILVITDVSLSKENEKVRSEFFANASHELKTPLTSIIGFSDLLSLTNKDEQLNKYIQKISTESKRMQNLIEDMLKLSKLENRKETEYETVDVKKTCEEVITSLEVLIDSKKINVSLVGQGLLEANKNDIYEVIKNLVENSIKYNNINGHVEVSILEDKSSLSLQIKDDGIGIEKKDQSRIFERFYRVDKSRSSKNGGTGLGLAIVKHILELYQASITLESSLGKGTTILIKFPKDDKE